MQRFRPSPRFLFAAVDLDDQQRPERILLIRGSKWSEDERGALNRNDHGGANGPYVEIRSKPAKYQKALMKYFADRVIPTL